MLGSRVRAGLLGLVLVGIAAPAGAQSWPSDAGPTSDYLGLTLRQFERLAPPPIEAQGVIERVVPDMPASDLGTGSVEVGRPIIAPARTESYRADPARARPRRFETRRFENRRFETRGEARRRSRATVPVAGRGVDREELRRELQDRDRQIRDLQRQIDEGRRAQEPRGAGSSLFGVNPAAAATVTPR